MKLWISFSPSVESEGVGRGEVDHVLLLLAILQFTSPLQDASLLGIHYSFS